MVTPTGYTALDLIGFTDKGAYDGTATYVKNDLVHHGGNVWRVLVDDVTGIIPSEGINYTLFIGEPTNLVERIIAPLEINPSEHAWTVGRQFIYNDLLYEVIDTIAIGDSLVAYESDPTNANIKLALPVETQLLALKALDEAIVDVIAPTETSPATAAHAVGEQFFYNGKIYTVTTAIEIGHTLTVGTNITESDTLTEQIDSKQDKLTFDSTPTANSTNPVTSGGVKAALDSRDTAMLNVLGAKNLLPNNAPTSYVGGGITFTKSADGSFSATAGTVSSTITEYKFVEGLILPKGKYIFSGFPDGSNTDPSKIFMEVKESWGGLQICKISASNLTKEFTVPNDNYPLYVRIYVVSGEVLPAMTFKPMIRPASIVDDTYVSYAMTNRELTRKLSICECLVLSASGVSALPYDFSNANIETDMVCINSVLSNPSAQLSDWEVDTDTAGRARVTGTISGTTDIKLYLMKSR